MINAKIAGQGTMVDVGGALPEILNGILELATAPAPVAPVLEVISTTETDETESAENALARLQLNGEPVTLEALRGLTVGDEVLHKQSGAITVHLGITYIRNESALIRLFAGYINSVSEEGFFADICIAGNESFVYISEL